MRPKLLLGFALTLATASCLAGSASNLLEVQVTLNNTCISSSALFVGSAEVNVRCSGNVFVNIAQIGNLEQGDNSPSRSDQLLATSGTEATSRATYLAQTQTQASSFLGQLGTQRALHIANSARGEFAPPIEMMVTF
ncbi:hypothetical protein HC248_02405 [Polaromonas vacuolata]|uniref:Spore coat protein U domain-containing protein n=1 Tax=Polaromonas vacuolata TaxID=37448 RepID=A0A6H2HB41_9BURK|nr:hypothetical protein [Polaromonas vacuolata]QJC57089.1 hypothetical protein HC248_02405 [Polaromonas vacuolata]